MSYNPATDGSTSSPPFSGSARSLASGYQNASGGTLAKATPVSVNASGQLIAIDVSNQAIVQAMVGLTTASIPNAANGQITDSGRLENVTSSFTVGDALYVSKTGGITNLKPDIGTGGFVSGDFVIFIGVLVNNEFVPANLDIKLMLSTIGQL